MKKKRIPPLTKWGNISARKFYFTRLMLGHHPVKGYYVFFKDEGMFYLNWIEYTRGRVTSEQVCKSENLFFVQTRLDKHSTNKHTLKEI